MDANRSTCVTQPTNAFLSSGIFCCFLQLALGLVLFVSFCLSSLHGGYSNILGWVGDKGCFRDRGHLKSLEVVLREGADV